MDDTTLLKKDLIRFLTLYALTSAAYAVYNTFVPVYLNQVGFENLRAGILLAVGPFIALIAQPFWGITADRAKTKNGILRLMLAGSVAAFLFYPLSNNFYYLLACFCVFTFFNTSVLPLQDAITLEGIENTGWKYGNIRMAGSVGYAVMSVLAGLVSNWSIQVIFPLYALICLAGFAAISKIPVVEGHQSAGNKLSLWKLFQNGKLILLTCFTFVQFIPLGYYYSFFPIYYRQMGASNLMLGVSMFLSAIVEVPFLIFAGKVVNKLGIELTLACASIVMGIRWLLLYLVSDVNTTLVINMTHGLSFIVCAYCMVTFINNEVPMELKASGQTLYALVSLGVSRIMGSVLGGMASDAFGIRQVFLYGSILAFLAVAIFISITITIILRFKNTCSGIGIIKK